MADELQVFDSLAARGMNLAAIADVVQSIRDDIVDAEAGIVLGDDEVSRSFKEKYGQGAEAGKGLLDGVAAALTRGTEQVRDTAGQFQNSETMNVDMTRPLIV